jgi:hypothetical protein
MFEATRFPGTIELGAAAKPQALNRQVRFFDGLLFCSSWLVRFVIF